MTADALRELQFSPETAKRAQYEGFEFELEDPGLVLVRNTSWDDPTEHEYLVNVVDSTPTVCECPADKHHEGACKHRVAVAIRGPVIQAASERSHRPVGVAKEDTPTRYIEPPQEAREG